MTSLIRWVTGREERSPPSHSAQVARRHADTGQLASPLRGATDSDSVTYASRDPKRDVQFVCHLPEGSPLAEQAQKIAGAVYSGRPAGRADSGRKMVTDGSDNPFVGAGESKKKVGRHSGESKSSVAQASEVEDEDEQGTTRRRSKKKSTSLPSRHTSERDAEAVRSVMAASNAPRDQPQPGGFRHQSETHVSYNIKQKDGGRHLFVSAPVGSQEAATHDQVAARAANRAPVSDT